MSDEINIGSEEIVTFTAVPSANIFVECGLTSTCDAAPASIVRIQNMAAADGQPDAIVITPNEYVFTPPE